jgi:HK97 family phage major capsid protein
MAMTTGGSSAILTPSQVEQLVILPLIAESVAAHASQVININSHSVKFPRVTQDANASWTLENTEIATSDVVTDELTCTPSALKALSVVSNELMADSSPAAATVVGQSIVRDLRREVDAAWLTATTTNGPSGLPSLTTSVASAGGAWSNFDWAQAAISACETLHSSLTNWVTSPATALALSNVKQFSTVGSNVPLMQPDPTRPGSRVIAGIPVLVSPSCAADTIWGVPQQHCMLVLRQPATVVSDGSALFTKDSTAIRAVLRIGFCFTYPLTVVKISKT